MTVAAILSGAYTTKGITASTNVRDVSDMLDLWAHKDTPLLNRISWADESGGLQVEWLSEHLGFGYIQTSGAIASDASTFLPTTSGTGLATAEVIKQVSPGSLLYAHISGGSSGTGEVWMTVVSVASATSAIDFSFLVTTSEAIAASAKLYIVGHFAQEGSEPFDDNSRKRTILTNEMTILRKDIQITGSQAATDMYAVDSEPRHQMAMRLLEMQFERERSILFSTTQARSTTVSGLMNGVFGFFLPEIAAGTSRAYLDVSTTTLTESVFNDLVAECWDNGGTPNVFVGSKDQMRKFTDWDDSKVRTKPDARLGGHWITTYLTDVGLEIDLIPLRKAPVNTAFVLDTDLMKLRAKKGRKLIIEELGKKGDYKQWQMISEYTMELRKWNEGAHGMFTELT